MHEWTREYVKFSRVVSLRSLITLNRRLKKVLRKALHLATLVTTLAFSLGQGYSPSLRCRAERLVFPRCKSRGDYIQAEGQSAFRLGFGAVRAL